MDLTDRQISILKAVVQEYSHTAQPVGSETLDRKYGLGISPATIRNEMVNLSETGYLSQPHISSGRTPTPKAIKFYINQLMKERDLSVAEEVAVKEQIWDHRQQLEELLRQATKVLSDKTNMLAVAATDDRHVYHSGYAHILDIPEFFDIDVTRNVLNLIDEATDLLNLFNRDTTDPVQILIGEDFGTQAFRPVGMVCTHFQAGPITGTLGVIGPSRLNYPYVIPMVKYMGRLVNEISPA